MHSIRRSKGSSRTKRRNKPTLVAVLDGVSAKEFKRFPGADRFRILADEKADSTWLARHLPGADAYFASLRVPLTAELIASAHRLQVVGSNTTGTDHLDVRALRKHGIKLLSLKNDIRFLRSITSTAELSFALLMACARRLRECSESTRQGHWRRHELAGPQLKGKTLGIVGCGRLGRMVAAYGRAFGMRILAADPRKQKLPRYIESVSLHRLLTESDFVSVHVHLTDETRHLLGRKEFRSIKRGAVLINTSRGGLVDEAALLSAMKSGRVAAAGLDVIEGEWLADKRRHPLIAYSRTNPNLVITPHVGGTCPDAIKASIAHTLEKMAGFFEGKHRLGPT